MFVSPVHTVEREIEVILNNLIRAEAGGVKGSLPILVVRAGTAIRIPIQAVLLHDALRHALCNRACRRSGCARAVGVVVFLDAAIDRHGRVGADLELRVAHVEPPRSLVVVGDVPGIGEHAETLVDAAQAERQAGKEDQAGVTFHRWFSSAESGRRIQIGSSSRQDLNAVEPVASRRAPESNQWVTVLLGSAVTTAPGIGAMG